MPMGSGLTTRGPRNLLRQIREAMAGGGPAQERLDMVVRIIASSMVAEVCSIYLRRATGELELFATEGLDPERRPRHPPEARRGPGRRDHARLGRPLNLSDAPSHPAFSYRPGNRRRPLPRLPRRAPAARRPRHRRAGRPEPHRARVYAEDEVEDLQIIAMVLAEMVASGELLGVWTS